MKRILTYQGTVVDCSKHFPVKFTISKDVSLCQIPNGFKSCNTPRIIYPKVGREGSKLKTLTVKEGNMGAVALLSDIKRIVVNYLTRMNYQKSLDAAITYNAKTCDGALWCPNESIGQFGSCYNWGW